MGLFQSPTGMGVGAELEEELGAVPNEKSGRPSGIDPRSGGGGPLSEGVMKSQFFMALPTGAAVCQALLIMPLYSC